MRILSNAFSSMLNAELRNKRDCIISPASKLTGNILRVLQMGGYIGKFEFIDDGRFGKFDVQLLGRINKCGIIRPSGPCKVDELETWEQRVLPSRDFGLIILSTPKGIMSHKDAKQNHIGGYLLAFIY
ncbi:MAG: 30S ribosomal protein S8 [Candidatus Bathyarchaeota archaeon]